ncbi:MAG TPA: GDSL-type esterase/lipase family protein [Pedobacter sp.]|uniref:GDSL-type esterase/lipase family protein n=1 Tax=Pedobacter sp. TaxID=1411316 RepID=UPI002BD7F7B9|nr:GDSL-type esterase/lipase family protein [Pedobacter sp.]HMI01084.1 GDSL-type esterase/lipase family protein [Pedobacter sp.]
MKALCCQYALVFFIVISTAHAQTVLKNQDLQHAKYLSLDGKALSGGNKTGTDGKVYLFKMPLLRLQRTTSKTVRGTVLLLPGGEYKTLTIKNDGQNTALSLNKKGYDVAILDYHIGSDPYTRDLALKDATSAFKLIKESRTKFGLRGSQADIAGIGAGGHVAARMLQYMDEQEQPDSLSLISPSYLDETLPGTVFPAVPPPLNPKAKLGVTFTGAENIVTTQSGREYKKTWTGYSKGNLNPNPAAIPIEGYSRKRHDEKLALVSQKKFDLIMLGNSITNNFEKQEYQQIWKQFFEPRNALNLGFSGYRTENLLWNIENGELEKQSPKVLVLEIGTNNVDEKNYPTRHTAIQLAEGMEAIVKLLRKKLPSTKIIILRCFPGAYGGPNPTSHRAILERASDIATRLADNKDIFYCDVNHVFLNFDGSINKEFMPDYLHPSPAGAKLWAQAMEPLLSSLMGDHSLDNDIPKNTAISPVAKLENDSYNWWDRHAEVLRIKDSVNPEIVLIGNSITHFWGGQPKLVNNNGQPRTPNGPKAWDSVFAKHRVLNLGFGWDRTQNALWRLDHGEIDGLHPRTIIVDIGTNNTSQTENARMNTASEIVEGIRAVCLRLRSKVPYAKIIIMAIFPREKDPQHPRRLLINEINRELAVFAKENHLTLSDVGPKMLNVDGTFLPGIMLDYTHPADKGYQIWADAIRPYIDER